MKINKILRGVGITIKVIIKLAIFGALIWTIIYLFNSENGILAKTSKTAAQEKLNAAMKIFASTDGMKLEDALREIEGLDNLDINEESGTYNITIDGKEFLVVSQEVIPNDMRQDEENAENIPQENTVDIKAEARVEM